MRLVLARTWIDRHFDPADAPEERTVRSWVRNGQVRGREIGRRVYIDDEAFQRTTGNEIADKIIEAASIHRAPS